MVTAWVLKHKGTKLLQSNLMGFYYYGHRNQIYKNSSKNACNQVPLDLTDHSQFHNTESILYPTWFWKTSIIFNFNHTQSKPQIVTNFTFTIKTRGHSIRKYTTHFSTPKSHIESIRIQTRFWVLNNTMRERGRERRGTSYRPWWSRKWRRIPEALQFWIP